MPPAPSPKKGGTAFPCEVNLQQLKNCLVNLPSDLVSVLVDNNIIAQNVVLEIVIDTTPLQSGSPKKDGTAKPTKRSIYVGWSGMSSRRKVNSVVGREGLHSRSAQRGQEARLLEIDATFAKVIGLTDAQQIGILMHTRPAEVHTINIEPLTPADWEIIELHANFLEVHLISQIRAVPNPGFKSSAGPAGHPLTLHLSPTSTANVAVSAISPSPPETSAFAKIAPNSEIIVAPKTRQQSSHAIDDDGKSAHSIGARSGTSTANTKSRRAEQIASKPPVFLRGVDRHLAEDWFDGDDETDKDDGYKVWVDWSVVTSKDLRGVSHGWVSIVRPSGLAEQIDEDPEALKAATRVVAQLCPWEESPDSLHVAISSQLATALDASAAIGETVRIEAAPPQATKAAVRSIRILPFSAPSNTTNAALKFGGKSRAENQEVAQRIIKTYGSQPGGNKLLDGPLTDGMIIPAVSADPFWEGGIIKLHPPPGPPIDQAKTTRGWLMGSERKLFVNTPAEASKPSASDRRLAVEIMAEIPRPPAASRKWRIGERIRPTSELLVGVDGLMDKVYSHLAHSSSTLLTGGIGSGKTSIAQLLGHRFQRELFYSVTYFPCHTLVTEETRVTTIKDTLERLFALAAWRSRFNGRSLVILDNLDKLCPVETELEVGGQNERNRQISEIITSIVRQYCNMESNVVLLATAQGKDAIHNTLIVGHVVRETVHLQAPDKEARRKVLQALVYHETHANRRGQEITMRDQHVDGNGETSDEPGAQQNQISDATGIIPDPNIDYLDLAGRCDGYMPGDLRLLITRARHEAVIRHMSQPYPSNLISLTTEDFIAALKGFTPSSLRNVTLTQSSTTFSSIGGLRDTRQTLLETLQYPTLYAPIFAKCPLRLRSGLLLYGFPGCGKTLLASAVAGECGLNFISVKGPEILNKYIGASEKSVRDLFERAQAARPCVLFFDEFDSVAPKRGHDSTGVTDRVVNQLLTQMDGAEGLSGVYVLAATSRPDLIDPALLRPGRLDKSLLCDMPDFEDRLDILRAIGSKLRLDASVMNTEEERHTLRELARHTEGFSGADLQAVVYNAHLEAIHDVLGSISVSSKSSQKSGSIDMSKIKAPEFEYFRMDAGQNAEPMSAAQRAVERSKIAQSLVAQRIAQQKAKAAKRGLLDADSLPRPGSSNSGGGSGGAASGSAEPVIEWKHIERAMAQTRPSLSRQEVGRLTRIYKEFVVGRSGDLKDGQGGTEIGGRSSLM